MLYQRFSRLVVLVMLPVLFLLAACSGSTSPTPAASEPKQNAPATGGATPAKKLKVAMILPGKINDQNYNTKGHKLLMRVKDELGAEVAFTEEVANANQVEAFRDYASRGYDLVIGMGGQFEGGAVEVAKEFPKVKFAVVNGVGGNGTNFSSYDIAGEQWQYVAGYVAGLATKSGKIGYISGGCFDATARQMYGTKDGVLAAKPGATFTPTFVGDWEDPNKSKEAALALIGNGADVLLTNVNNGTLGIIEAAKQVKQQQGKTVYVITEWTDTNHLGPEVVLSSVLKDLTGLGVIAAKKVMDGTFDGKPFRQQLSDPNFKVLADFHGLGSAEWMTKAQQLTKDIAEQKIKVVPNGKCQ